MNKREWRTLRIQFYMVGALFIICIAGSIWLANERPWFEKYFRETYRPAPTTLKSLCDQAAAGELNRKAFDILDQSERSLMYDDWMLRSHPRPEASPRLLLAADPPIFLSRVERTLVCGNAWQIESALTFLEIAGRRDAMGIVQRAAQRAVRRKQPELAARFQKTIGILQAIPATLPAATASRATAESIPATRPATTQTTRPGT